MGSGVKEFGYRLWDPEAKKVVRSRDVIFCEDQTIEDFGKIDNLQDYMKDLVNLGPNAPPVIHDNGGDVQEEQQEVFGENHHLEKDVEQEEEQSQELPQVPLPEPQVRRSSREPQPSTKYSPNE